MLLWLCVRVPLGEEGVSELDRVMREGGDLQQVKCVSGVVEGKLEGRILDKKEWYASQPADVRVIHQQGKRKRVSAGKQNVAGVEEVKVDTHRYIEKEELSYKGEFYVVPYKWGYMYVEKGKDRYIEGNTVLKEVKRGICTYRYKYEDVETGEVENVNIWVVLGRVVRVEKGVVVR